jgi:HSP20 family protein
MTKEPRSFFERLTGARLLGQRTREEDEDTQEDTDTDTEVETPTEPETTPDTPEPEESEPEVEAAIEEPENETEEGYSDEKTGEKPEEEQEGQLTVDVFQDDQHIVIQSTIAGVNPEDLDVSITNDMVTIRGERRRAFEVKTEDYFYQECYWGPFSRSIILPLEIDADAAEAKIKNGVLTIRIPKAGTTVTRKVKVKAN